MAVWKWDWIYLVTQGRANVTRNREGGALLPSYNI